MKFTCEKNALVSAISVASRTVAQKSTIPALEGIYIRAGVKLTLSGYNLETGITISVDAEIQQTGACIMPSRLFFDIIRKLPGDTVSISVDEKFKVSIRGGISSFSITAMSSEDYPELPEVESDKGISLPQNELKAMIGGTSFAVSENQARPIQTGCLMEVTEDSVTMVAVQVMANDVAVSMAASQGNFELNVFMPVCIYNFLQSARLLAESIVSFNDRCACGIRANREKMEHNLHNSLMLVTALNPYIGYENAAKTAKKAYKENISLKEACVSLGFLTAERFDEVFHPENMI